MVLEAQLFVNLAVQQTVHHLSIAKVAVLNFLLQFLHRKQEKKVSGDVNVAHKTTLMKHRVIAVAKKSRFRLQILIIMHLQLQCLIQSQ